MLARLSFLLAALAGALSAQTCTFTISASQQSFPQSGGSGTITITASNSSCQRNVVSSDSWVVITFGQQGTGSGSAGFTVAVNSVTPNRMANIMIVNGPSITITQSGPACNFAVTPTSASISPAAQSGSLSLSGLAGCQWTATTNATWLTLNPPSSGTGPSTITYQAQANPGSTSRSGAILLAGLTFTVTQAGGCAYTINPTTGSFPASGGTGMFNVTSNSGCAWTASSNATWIRITAGSSGSGAGSVSFVVNPNTGDARTGAISVGNQTFSITQTGQSCSYTLTPASQSFPAGGGTAAISVTSSSTCSWTAATTASWITIVAGSSGSGSGVIAISIAANTGAARTDTITAGGQTFTAMQAGAGAGGGGIVISPDQIKNSASGASGTVSPGLIVTLYVPGVGPADLVTEQLTPDGSAFTTGLAGIQVLFDGTPAPMVYAANGQLSAIVPYEVAGNASTQLQISNQGTLSNIVTITVALTQPGLFTADSSGVGPGAITDTRYNINSASNPAALGSTILLYATGEGQTSPAGVDGKIAVTPLPAPVAPVTVTIGGINAPVLYAGGAPGLVAGLIQINAQIPPGVPSGPQPVVVQFGQAQSQAGVTVAIQ